MVSDYILNAIALNMVSNVGGNVLIIIYSKKSEGCKTNQCQESLEVLYYAYNSFKLL